LKCQCERREVLKDNEATLFKRNFLELKKYDSLNWKNLYQCKVCHVFWEETFEEARWVDIPILQKVKDEYVRNNWDFEKEK